MKTIIKELRKMKLITQQELANELGLSRQTISYIENGVKVPSITIALKIAEFFSIPVEKIFQLETKD